MRTRLHVLLLWTLVASACGEPQGPPESRSYLVSDLWVPEPTPRVEGRAGVAAGIDLDGRITVGDLDAASCVDIADDYQSLEVPGDNWSGMELGVDNAFAGLVPSLGPLIASSCPRGTVGAECVHQLILDSIARGEMLLLIQVDDIESYVSDRDGVTVGLFVGRRPDCFAGCSWSGDACEPDARTGSRAAHRCTELTTPTACTDAVVDLASCMPLLAGATVAPSQELERGPAIGESAPGRIDRGRLRAVLPSLALEMATPDFTIPVPLRPVTVDAAITAGGLASGVLAGEVAVDDILPEPMGICGGGCSPTARSLLEGIADLHPSSDPLICTSLSAGFDLEAVEVDVSP